MRRRRLDYFFRLGLRFLEHGEVSEAIEAFTTSIALAPDARSFCYRGLTYFKSKDFPKALSDYTRAIELDDPSVPEAYYFRRTLQGLLSNYDDAIQDLTKLIEQQGEDWMTEAFYYRAASFGAIGEYCMAIDDMRVAAKAGHGPAREFLRAKGLGW